jgi:RNA polymerase sigma-70 factor (ECF subfamily)
MFACCHPSIAPDSQVAVTLKIIGGFSVSEISRAYLSNDDTTAKMLTRAKKKLRASGVAPDIPPPSELASRLDSVLKVLYLMFNEGYAASGGDELVRKDLCFEAIRLGRILAAHPLTAAPRVHALLALFHFQGARLSARSGHRGELLLLADQDRTVWDSKMLSAGLDHFQLSASGSELSDFHLEAEIAATHALAPTFEATDWQRILELYERLQSRHFSAVAELNKMIVLEKLYGPERSMAALKQFEDVHDLNNFNLFHVTKAHFLAQTGQIEAATRSYERAVELTANNSVRRFLADRIETLRSA